MDYEDKKDGYAEAQNGETAYYVEDAKKPEETKKLPTFQEIFYDVPLSGSIVSFSEYHNGIVYFSSMDTHVYAVDAQTGEMKWKFKTGMPLMSTPLVHRNRIYFGSNDEYFYCLDLDGRLLWKKHTGDIIVSSPIGIGDKIIIGNGKGYVFCFSPEGEEQWRFRTGDGIIAVPSAVNGLVFIGSYDKSVHALDMNGNLTWKFTAGERTSAGLVMEGGENLVSPTKRSWDRMPKAGNPVIYCGSYDNHLYALSQDGRVLWKFNCGSSVPGGIGGDHGIVYAGTITGTVYAIDAFSGAEKWHFRSGGMVTGGGEIKDGRVYFNSFDQKLYCLSEDGQKLWDFLTGGPIVSRPLIVGDRLYFGSADTFFYCINIKERQVEWTFQVGFGLPDTVKSYAQNFVNALIEYDRKIFKIWRPETARASGDTVAMRNYKAPSEFAFGGFATYASRNPYKTGAETYRTKRGYSK